VLDMAAGYSTLANQGIAKSPIVVTRVEFPDGTVKHYSPAEKRVLTTDQAGRVTYSLRQVIDGGTGREANFGRPAAGKTGTTQNNADGWFVGYTPKLTAAVWMGHPEGLVPMTNVHGVKVQGGTFPARMWKNFMQSATANFDTGDFPELDDEVLNGGETLDLRYGQSAVVGSGSGQTPTTKPRSSTATTAATTQQGSSTSTPATSPATSTPPATTPPTTTAPTPTTAPPPKKPATAGGSTGGAGASPGG